MSTPRFLADEDFRFPLIQAVRRVEHEIEIQKVQELGLSGTQDSEVLQFAFANNLIILSHDVNTLRGLAEERIAKGFNISGLLFAAQSIPTRVFVEELRLIWGASEHEEWFNRIDYLPLK